MCVAFVLVLANLRRTRVFDLPGSDRLLPEFSVIIPTYNSVRTLGALLDSLDGQDFRDFEVIVVDDCSTDNTAEIVGEHSDVKYERLDANAGPSVARNRGVELASADWFVFTDSDTEFQSDTLACIRDALSARDMDALIGNYAGAPANDGFVPWYKGLWEYSMIEGALVLDGDQLTPISTWAPRPGVISRAAFAAVGGFSTKFRGADLEDLELGYRLSNGGFRTYVCLAVRIRHHYPESVIAELRPFARRSALWMRMATRRRALDSHGEGSGRQAIAHLFGFSGFCAFVVSLVWPPFVWVALGALAAFMMLNSGFFAMAFRERGLGFTVGAMGYCWIHSIVLGLAAGYGLVTAWQRVPFES